MNHSIRGMQHGLIGMLILSGLSIADEVRELGWEELVPDAEVIAPPADSGLLADEELIDDDEWDQDALEQLFSTPVYPTGVVEELDGIEAKIPGFVVPLELAEEGKIKEFLLVPYFGACIHYPPPPPNQIVYVVLDDPVDIESPWEPIWATGELRTKAYESELAAAGYTMTAQAIEEYEY